MRFVSASMGVSSCSQRDKVCLESVQLTCDFSTWVSLLIIKCHGYSNYSGQSKRYVIPTKFYKILRYYCYNIIYNKQICLFNLYWIELIIKKKHQFDNCYFFTDERPSKGQTCFAVSKWQMHQISLNFSKLKEKIMWNAIFTFSILQKKVEEEKRTENTLFQGAHS